MKTSQEIVKMLNQVMILCVVAIGMILLFAGYWVILNVGDHSSSSLTKNRAFSPSRPNKTELIEHWHSRMSELSDGSMEQAIVFATIDPYLPDIAESIVTGKCSESFINLKISTVIAKTLNRLDSFTSFKALSCDRNPFFSYSTPVDIVYWCPIPPECPAKTTNFAANVSFIQLIVICFCCYAVTFILGMMTAAILIEITLSAEKPNGFKDLCCRVIRRYSHVIQPRLTISNSEKTVR